MINHSYVYFSYTHIYREQKNDTNKLSKKGIQFDWGLWAIEKVFNDEHYRFFYHPFIDDVGTQFQRILVTNDFHLHMVHTISCFDDAADAFYDLYFEFILE